MLELFRTNQFAANIFLFLYVIVLRVSVIVFPNNWEPTSSSYFSNSVYDLVGTHTIAANVLAIILVFLQAFLINQLVMRYRMANEISLLPGLFYIILVSCFPEFLQLSPALMANTFYILALYSLFGSYKQLKASGQLFNLGFWVAIASLFYFSFSVFLLLSIIGISQLRAFRLKESLMILIGFLVPYYLLSAFTFWNNSLASFWSETVFNNFSLINLSQIQTSTEIYVKLGIFALLILLSVLSLGTYQQKKSIHVQKIITILYWGLLVTLLSLFLQNEISINHLIILHVPLSIFLAYSFLNFKKKQVAEALHLIMFLAILAFQLKDFFIA